MASILNKDDYQGIMQELGLANQVFQQKYKGESPDRQPVHTFTRGAGRMSWSASGWLQSVSNCPCPQHCFATRPALADLDRQRGVPFATPAG